MADASAKDTSSQGTHKDAMVQRYLRRQALWYRLFRPPLPLIANPHESSLPAAMEGPKLFVGGAGGAVQPGFLNLDLTYFPGVDLVADIECLPLPFFQCFLRPVILGGVEFGAVGRLPA